jgi:hypothetical protein
MPIIEFDAPFESPRDGTPHGAHRFGGGRGELAMAQGATGRSLNNGVGWVQVIRAARHETMRFEGSAAFSGPDARSRRPFDPPVLGSQQSPGAGSRSKSLGQPGAHPSDDLESARGIALGAIAGLLAWVLIAQLIASFFF